jgi:formate dehydrogenase subunit gamma
MKKWLASLAFGVALIAGAPATMAQGNPATPAAPAATPNQQMAAPGLPAVQSADILNLNQNQAERTAVQPGNLAPTWRRVKQGETFYTSLPYPEAGMLIQPKAQFPGQTHATTAGEAWRQYRNGPLTNIGGWLIIITLVALAVFYLVRGKIKLKEPRTGRRIERFTPFERVAHWTVAICFVLLALTGVIMLFGKYVLLPLFGHTLFGWLGFLSKNVHNFVGPVFTIATLVVFFIFVRDNMPRQGDVKWMTRLGGAIGKEPVHAGRFNSGEKLWFWIGVTVLGLIIAGSGLVLNMLVPGIVYTRGVMQVANVIHLISAVLMLCFAFGHIYLGTVGMEGAYDAMRHGYVDDTWAKEHHDLWYDDIRTGKVARVRSQEGGAATGEPVKV